MTRSTPAPDRSLEGARVLVTGASGFIGSHLVDRLAQEGAAVGALARHRGKLGESAEALTHTFLPCDLTDARETQGVVAAFAPEILLHFASAPDAREDAGHARAMVEANAAGTLNVLEAFRRCRGRLVVYGDSCKVYGNGPVPYREAAPIDPGSSYAIAKAAGWQFCRLYAQVHDLPAVSVRPTIIYGPRQGTNIISYLIDRLIDGADEIELDGGSQTRDPLFIDDAVEAIVAIARAGTTLNGRVINIGGGREISVRQLAELVVQAMDGRTRIVSRPHHARPTEIWRSFCDNAEAEDLIGWRPGIPLTEGIRITINYLLATRAAV